MAYNKYLITFLNLISIFLPFFILLPFLDDLEPLISAAIICGYQIVSGYIKSLIFDNLGIVDDIWFTAPFMYAWVLNNWSTRGIIMQIAVGIWAARLSFNFFRKGGFYGLQDYRWVAIKESINNKCVWEIIHICSWSIFPNGVNLWMVLPIYYISDSDLDPQDYVFTVLLAFFLLFEAIADE